MFGAGDPSAVDQAAPFTFSINWGDGATQVVSGPAGSQVDHTFASTGTYTVTVTATDKDGGTSLVTQQSINIKAVDLQGTALAVGGTTGSDSIVIKPANSSGSLNVTVNGVSQGTFARPGQLLVFAQAGNDNILFDAVKIQGKQQYVTAPAVILAGAGDDTIDARDSKADNILIGGAGADTVRGGGADDIVIGGTTDFDDNSMALLAMLAEWSREDINYQTRVGHLNGTLPGGLNGSFFLTAATVHDDSAIDQFYGEGGVEDWFFALTSGPFADDVRDRASAEFIVSL
jgi:PKD repeat protein